MARSKKNPTSKAELELADGLGYQLIRLIRLINRVKTQVSPQGPDDIERAAYTILFCLAHEGPLRTSRLAEYLHSEISTISRQSSRLVQHGLVERQADPEDGRACLLAPTAEGMRVFEENRKKRNQWLAGVLADWTEEDRQTLSTLFDRLNSGIEANVPHLADQMSASRAKGVTA